MATFENIKPGMTAEQSVVVTEKLAAMHTKPPVLSTPMMIELMEVVSKDMVQALLPDGFITVGYEVHIKHKAAAPVGAEVKAWAHLTEVDGRKLLFEVKVTMDEKIIGEGLHRRTIIPYSG
jgi:fluoroacetyl-CoA thioesterase